MKDYIDLVLLVANAETLSADHNVPQANERF